MQGLRNHKLKQKLVNKILKICSLFHILPLYLKTTAFSFLSLLFIIWRARSSVQQTKRYRGVPVVSCDVFKSVFDETKQRSVVRSQENETLRGSGDQRVAGRYEAG